MYAPFLIGFSLQFGPYGKVRAGETDMLVNNQPVINTPFIHSNSCQTQKYRLKTGYLNIPGVTFVTAK